MSRFTAPLVVTPLNDGRTWRILWSTTIDGEYPEDSINFGYDIGEEGSGLSVNVPDGFQTDFASIPRLLWWLMPTWGRYGNAAVIHDYLYSRGGKITIAENVYGIPEAAWASLGMKSVLPWPTRKQADLVMLQAMTVLEVSAWQKYLLYYGVRLTGWWTWRRVRK